MTKEHHVRRALPTDAEAVAHIYTKSFPEHIMVQRGILNNTTYLTEHFVHPEERWVVEEQQGTLRGVAALAIARPVGLGEIERVCVDLQHRGNNIAYSLCEHLVQEAQKERLGFVEAFARGQQPGMQKTFEKLGFNVYGISPRFEVALKGNVVRELFVHMGLLLEGQTIIEPELLIPPARRMYEHILEEKERATLEWMSKNLYTKNPCDDESSPRRAF